jgi:hypothetical protein
LVFVFNSGLHGLPMVRPAKFLVMLFLAVIANKIQENGG